MTLGRDIDRGCGTRRSAGSAARLAEQRSDRFRDPYAPRFGLFATSLNLLVGYAGMVSFGHGMFFGLGAYGFGLCMQSSARSIPTAFVFALFVSALSRRWSARSAFA